MIAVYPGSFDPFHNGHLDITERCAEIFDEVIVGVLRNASKNAMFTTEERCAMASEATAHIKNVSVRSFNGLLVDFMKLVSSRTIVRGLRAISDFEYEFQIAQLNRRLDPAVETFFMVTNAKYSYLSSRNVKEVASFGGSIDDFVPDPVLARIAERLKPKTFMLEMTD